MEGQGQNGCQVHAQFIHSGFATQDLLLRRTIRKGSDFPSRIEFSSVVSVDMDVVCFGIFANVY